MKLTPAEARLVEGDPNRSVARARLEALFDGGRFEEIGQGVQHRCERFGLPDKRVPGDGVITAFGAVDGRTVYAYAQDRTVLGGSLGAAHAARIARLQDMALQAGAPFVAMNDSGGARIQEGVESLGGYGDIFLRNVRASGRIPQIALICGPCAGGAVYSPALMDVVAMVEGHSYMFLTGPKVVETVTFEEISAEALGGGRVHAETSGVAHLLYPTDLKAIAGIRRLLGYLPSSAFERPPAAPPLPPAAVAAERLAAAVPDSARSPYDVREVIRGLFDEGSLFELHADWARNLVVTLARLEGEVVGIVANQPAEQAGCLDSEASRKGARFIRFCDRFGIPLISLIDVPGFLPGREQEHGGVIAHGAKLLQAYCEARVPRLSVILRKAYGGAYIVMSSRHIGGDLNWAWPGAEIAVMGAQGAVEVLFRRQLEGAADPEAKRAELEAEYREEFLNPRQALARGFIDAVIHPSETRERLAAGLRHLGGGRRAPAAGSWNAPV